MKKSFCLFIMIIMLISLLISCSETNNNEKNNAPIENGNNKAESQNAAENIDPRFLVSDDLPDTNLNGYNFRIYTHNYAAGGHADYVDVYCPESEIGEVINDSVYKRNKSVEERFNCTISTIDSGAGLDIGAHSQNVRKIILADDDVFDIALEHCVYGCNLSLEGLFLNLYDIEHFNFDKPWWYKTTVDEMTVMGQMYMGSNSIFYSGIAQTAALYINKNLLNDFNLEMPYKDVFDGTWTLDKLVALTKNVYQDVNGNGIRDSVDIYGYTTMSVVAGALHFGGNAYISKN